MKTFSNAILGISLIIVFAMAWLINYTMKFMLEKRSKEFGTYQVLGLKKKYKKSNMFLYRNLTSKINTMSITMGTIALMFTIILIGGNVALLMNNMLNNEIELGYPFEIMISASDEDFTKYKEYIDVNANVKEIYEYNVYDIANTHIHDALLNSVFEARYYEEKDSVILFKDYNKLREMLRYEKVELKDNEVIIQCMETAKPIFDEYIKTNNLINVANKNLNIKEVKGENLSQISFNGYTYCIIVPDNMKETIIKEHEKANAETIPDLNMYHKLVALTEHTTNEQFREDLEKLVPTKLITKTIEIDGVKEEYTSNRRLVDIQTRGVRAAEAKSLYAIISFLAFYVALIFVMATAILLAIQQLSDAEKYKYRYELLKKLGMDELEMNRVILKQLFLYFAIPMMVPFIISLPIILSVSHIFTIAVTIEEIISNIGIIYGLFILVDGIYFIATDIQFVRKFVYDFCDSKKVTKIENSKIFQNPKRIEMIMLILFLIPGTPKDLMVYIAGLLPIKPIKFILISTFARFPSVISSTLAGENFAVGDWKMSIIIYVVVFLIVGIIIFFINKFDKSKTTDEVLKAIK